MSVEFIDSNVFVYQFDETEPGKRQIATALVRGSVQAGTGVISFQVVQEVLNTVTRKLKVPVTAEDARRYLDQVLVPLWRVMPSQSLYQRALDIQYRYRYSFYDSLIIAAALRAGCTKLYSEDLQDGQVLEELMIENPFRTKSEQSARANREE